MDFLEDVAGDHPRGSAEQSSSPQLLSAPDPKALRRALFKLDAFLLPAVTMIYFLNFLDRSNIGNAKTAGLQTDLKLSNTQYSIALTVTYVPYIVAELPLTLAIKKIGPNILLPALVVSWGLVTTFQGFVHNYSGLLAARFFLGMTEGAILPSSITYLSTFYCRADLGKRVAFFFSATSLAGAFSGLLAAALLNMQGLGGKRGWQWIFIIEGLFTVVWGILSFFILPCNPQTTRYFREEERASLLAAHDADRQMEEEQQSVSVSAVLSALKAPQMWLIFIQFFCSGTTLYGLAYFAPTIVGGLGYNGTQVQLYSVPPYVCSAFIALTACWTSDYLRHRGLFVVAASLVSVVGYAMCLGSTKTHVLYASLFLQVIGAYTVAPLQSTWMPNNLAPFYQRVTGITLGFIATNSGGADCIDNAGDINNVPRFDLSSLRGMLSGAAPLGADIIEALERRLPSMKITQGYGLTETTPVTHVMTEEEGQMHRGQVGRVMPTFQARLIDVESGEDVEPGQPGELWLRGPSVMKGYWRNAEATSKAFAEGGWFRTGDVAIVDEHGYYTIVDRVKELIKYKGFQVPPAELEALLLTRPKIADAAVIGIYSREQATELPRAYVVPLSPVSDDKHGDFADEVMRWVAQKVSNLKRLRGGVVLIRAIPKSPSGKILRKQLRALAKTEREDAVKSTRPAKL